jgi:hypothetical protein
MAGYVVDVQVHSECLVGPRTHTRQCVCAQRGWLRCWATCSTGRCFEAYSGAPPAWYLKQNRSMQAGVALAEASYQLGTCICRVRHPKLAAVKIPPVCRTPRGSLTSSPSGRCPTRLGGHAGGKHPSKGGPQNAQMFDFTLPRSLNAISAAASVHAITQCQGVPRVPPHPSHLHLSVRSHHIAQLHALCTCASGHGTHPPSNPASTAPTPQACQASQQRAGHGPAAVVPDGTQGIAHPRMKLLLEECYSLWLSCIHHQHRHSCM